MRKLAGVLVLIGSLLSVPFTGPVFARFDDGVAPRSEVYTLLRIGSANGWQSGEMRAPRTCSVSGQRPSRLLTPSVKSHIHVH